MLGIMARHLFEVKPSPMFFCEVKGMSFGDYELRSVCGHIEVFLDGSFQFSADTVKEVTDELWKEESE